MVRLDLPMVVATAGGMVQVVADGLAEPDKTVATHRAGVAMSLGVQLWCIQQMVLKEHKVAQQWDQAIPGLVGLAADMEMVPLQAVKVLVATALWSLDI
jgi:hypothetical protein